MPYIGIDCHVQSLPTGTFPTFAMSQPTFETNLSALKTILQQLDREDIALADAMHLYEQGKLLRTECITGLASLQENVDNIQTVLPLHQDVSPDLSLQEIFNTIEELEQQIHRLSDTELEESIALLMQVETLLHAGTMTLQQFSSDITPSSGADRV